MRFIETLREEKRGKQQPHTKEKKIFDEFKQK